MFCARPWISQRDRGAWVRDSEWGNNNVNSVCVIEPC